MLNYKNWQSKYLLTLIILVIQLTPSYAEVTLIDSSIPLWEISGQITKPDLDAVNEAANFSSQSRKQAVFRLNSEGGDVETAIAIGRKLRKIGAFALTFHQGRCYSACVFILAGATTRGLSESIGVHRPFSTSTEISFQKIQTNQKRIENISKEYLKEVNVSPTLYDFMNSIPPERIHLLSKSELQNFGILEIDPVQQEIYDSAEARSFGISKIEYYKRKAQAEKICAIEHENGSRTSNFKPYLECKKNILKTGR